MVEFTLKQVAPKIWHLNFSSGYDLTIHFFRFQEYYESPDMMKKNVQFVDLMENYTKKLGKGKFTYINDWAGFNIPGEEIFQRYKDGISDPKGDGNRFTQFMDSSSKKMEELEQKRREKSRAEREEHERIVQEFLNRKDEDKEKEPEEIQKSREKLKKKKEDDKKKEEFSKLSLTERDNKIKEIQQGLKLIVQKKRTQKPTRDVLPDGSKWIAMDKKGPWFLIRPGHGDKFRELYKKYMEFMKLMKESK